MAIALLEPPEDWLTRLPHEAVRREIRMLTMAEAWTHERHGKPAPAVVEANAAWASGHYAADPERVLDVVLRAAGRWPRRTSGTGPSCGRPPDVSTDRGSDRRVAPPRRAAAGATMTPCPSAPT